MKVIYINNYGKKKDYHWDTTFEEMELEDLRIKLRDELRKEIDEHVGKGSERWICKGDYESWLKYLEGRFAKVENKNATPKDVSSAIRDGACVSIPKGISTEDFIDILKTVYNAGSQKGWEEGRSS